MMSLFYTIVITHDGSMGLVYLPTIYHKNQRKDAIHGSYGYSQV